QIGLHLTAPLTEAGREMLPAQTRGAAKLRLQYGIAARRQCLRPPIEARFVLCRRTAMRENDERKILRRTTPRQREIGRNRSSVCGRIGNVFHVRNVGGANALEFCTDRFGNAGIEVDEFVLAAAAQAVDAHEYASSVAACRNKFDRFAGKGL